MGHKILWLIALGKGLRILHLFKYLGVGNQGGLGGFWVVFTREGKKENGDSVEFHETWETRLFQCLYVAF